MDVPKRKRSVGVVWKSSGSTRIIVLDCDAELCKELGKFGKLVPTNGAEGMDRYNLYVDGRYDFGEVVKYIEWNYAVQGKRPTERDIAERQDERLRKILSQEIDTRCKELKVKVAIGPYRVTDSVDRPYIFYRMRVEFTDKSFVGDGFAKVCKPDDWDEKTGLLYAANRARQKIIDALKEEREKRNAKSKA